MNLFLQLKNFAKTPEVRFWQKSGGIMAEMLTTFLINQDKMYQTGSITFTVGEILNT